MSRQNCITIYLCATLLVAALAFINSGCDSPNEAADSSAGSIRVDEIRTESVEKPLDASQR